MDGVQRVFSGYELSFLYFESYDGIRGRGMLDMARETIGAEGAAQQYGRKFYQNGAMISGIVEVDTDLSPTGKDRIREQFYGRSYADSPDIDGRVWIASDEPVTIGDFVWVKIDGCLDGDLSGYVVEEAEQ